MWQKNIFITRTIIANKSVNAIQAQKKDLNLLAAILLNNKIPLVYLLAEQCGIYLVANTFSCTRINVSQQAKNRSNAYSSIKVRKRLHTDIHIIYPYTQTHTLSHTNSNKTKYRGMYKGEKKLGAI